jgi:hypothetical protein
MIRLKNILLEEPKSPSEDPDKMLVKNKESGKSYYISKASFDPSIHEKPEEKKKKKKEEPSTPKKEKGGGGGLMDKLKAEKEKSSSGEEEEKPEEKKETPSQKLEKKLGSFVFVDEKEKEEIADDARSMRPDLKEKLLKFDFTSFFREYDSLMDTLGDQQDKKDNEGAKETVIAIRKAAKRIQGVAIAKLAALSTFKNDPEVITASKYYHNDSTSINEFLRQGGEINWSLEDLKKTLDTPNAKEKFPLKYKMYNVLTLDNHFKTDGAKLQNDTVVYRGVKDDILKKFVESGEWVDNGFVSTSLNPLIAEDFTDRNLTTGNRKARTPIFKINLKRGNPVLMLPCSEDEFCIESEITLPRGCKFTITGKDEEKNIYDISVEFPNA